jgi:CxxC-x17-CxxC domain-containing protein
MKKKAKTKKSRKSATVKNELPSLVDAMVRLVERLETLERKTDQIMGRVANLPNEVRRAVQDLPRAQTSQPAQPSHSGAGPRERILYQAVCADCQKRCEVPFRPSGDRPVYCPECWAIRKAGHVPKDLTSHVVVPQHMRELKSVSGAGAREGTASKNKGSKSAKRDKKTASKAGNKKKKK